MRASIMLVGALAVTALSLAVPITPHLSATTPNSLKEACVGVTWHAKTTCYQNAVHSCHIMAKLEDCTEVDRACKIAHTLGGRAARCMKKPVTKTKPSSSVKPPAPSDKPIFRRGGDTPDYDSHPTFDALGRPSSDEAEEQGANMDPLTTSEEQELRKKCEGANKKFPMQSVCQRNWIFDCTTKTFAQRCQLLESEAQGPLMRAFGMFGLCQQEYIPLRAAKCLTEEGLRKRYEGLMAFMRIAGKVPEKKHDQRHGR